MSAALGLVGHSGIITACVNVRAFGYVPSIKKVVYSEHDLWYSAMVNTPLKASLLLPSTHVMNTFFIEKLCFASGARLDNPNVKGM